MTARTIISAPRDRVAPVGLHDNLNAWTEFQGLTPPGY